MKYDYSKYVGIPYRPRGRDVDGMDCWGLVWHVYVHLYNIELPHIEYTEDYKITSHIPLHEMYKMFEEVSEVQEGDIILLQSLGRDTHVAVAIDGLNMLHSEKEHTTSSVERIRSPRWASKISKIYRCKEFK